MKSRITKQFKGESAPRSLYRVSRSGGKESLETYAFSARQVYDQAGFKHRIVSETEDEIQAARRIYNSNVQIYNTRIQIFPNSLIAARGDFQPRQFFEIEVAAEREVPQVSFT